VASETPTAADETLPLIVPQSAPADSTPAAATTDVPAATTTPADPPEFEIPAIEYRPLDDDLKASIRDELLDKKVRDELDKQVTSVLEEMERLSRDRQSIRRKLTNDKRDITTDELYDAMREHNPKITEQLKELGTRTGLAFAESPLLSMEELTDFETWPIGTATEPAELFMPTGNSVVDTISQVFPIREPMDDIELFDPRHAVRNSFDPDGGETHFAWWIVEFSPPHLPKLDDPGIREEVVLTWKRAKALELAKQRGEALATLVRDGLSKPEAERRSMAQSLEGQTLTGTDKSAVVAVRQTDPFSWYEQSFVPDATFNPRPQLRLSEVRYRDETGGTIRYAGADFMKSVFEDLQNEQVGVVMNDNRSSVFVAHVTERLADDEVLKTQFLTEGRRTRFSSGPVGELVRGLVSQPASVAWEQSVWDKYQARAPQMLEE
jgi:hypothetical protein